MSSTDDMFIDPLLEGYYEITISYARYEFWNFLKSTLTRQATLVARHRSLSAIIEAAILIKTKVGLYLYCFKITDCFLHSVPSGVHTIKQKGLVTRRLKIDRISARGHLHTSLEANVCLLTHWGRVTQIWVFTLQLCKTDDANLRF